MPFVTKKDDLIHTLGYLFDDKDFHDKKAIEQITKHPDSKRLGNQMAQEETWTMPDFRPWFCDFQLQAQGIVSANTPVFSVHIPTHVQTLGRH
jgi:hypothetical protein